MRAATLDKFRAVVTHPETVRAFGLAPATLEAETIDPQVLASVYSLLGDLRSTYYEKHYKLPKPVAKELGAYSSNQLQVIVPLTQKVIAKHSGEFARKWGEEIALVMILVSLEMQKMRAAEEMFKRMETGALPVDKANGAEKSSAAMPIVDWENVKA